jgi:hypothetical protein
MDLLKQLMGLITIFAYYGVFLVALAACGLFWRGISNRLNTDGKEAAKALMCAVCGVAILIYGISLVHDTWRYSVGCSSYATAIVTDTDIKDVSDEAYGDGYRTVSSYRFHVGSKTYNGSAGYGEVGEEIKICYDPGDPHINRELHDKEPFSAPFIFFVFLVPVVVELLKMGLAALSSMYRFNEPPVNKN